jgi:ribosomal protein S18
MIDGLPVDYKDVDVLLNYISDRAKITSAYRIGNNAKDHRSLTAAIKRARFMALLPISHDHEIIRTPKEEPKAETPKEEPKAETPKEEPKAETPKEEPKAETPKEEPKAKTPEEKNKEEDKK